MTTRIIITPDETIVTDNDKELMKLLPDSITIVLDDGQMFNIQQVAELLAKKVKTKREGKISKFKRAFSKAMTEMSEEEENNHVRGF